MFSRKTALPLFFVHIPKTAGTSFRQALMGAIKGKSLLDYGAESKTTSKEVKKFIYSNLPQNRAAIAQLLADGKFDLLTGHVGFAKYRGVVPIDRVVTFLRRPEDQVWSHYQHHCELLNYQGSLEEFATDKRFSNMQSRHLSGCKVEALGFVGLTERFDESIVLFNALFDWTLDNLSLNRRSNAKTCSETERSIIVKSNQQDIALYKQVESRFEQQMHFLTEGLTWTDGWVSCNTSDGILSAQVWQAGTVNPVDIEVHYDDDEVHHCVANQHSAVAASVGAPNAGYVGVRHSLRKGKQVSTVTVKNTGQTLPVYLV
jgi:hypothetical protein